MDLTGSGAGRGLFNSRGRWTRTCLRSCLVSTWALPPGPPHIANLPHKAAAAKKRPRAVLLGGRPWGNTPRARSPGPRTAHAWLTADSGHVREHRMGKSGRALSDIQCAESSDFRQS